MNKNLIIEEEKSSKLLDIITTVITYIIVGLCLVVSIFSLTSKATGGTPRQDPRGQDWLPRPSG